MLLKTASALLITLSLAAAQSLSLDGEWRFDVDPLNIGEQNGWFSPSFGTSDWRIVTVPHTWQVDAGFEDYYGFAWYRRSVHLDAPEDAVLRLEFDAVYRDADVWVNGQKIGSHYHSGWTPFALTVPVDPSGDYLIAVRTDNRFSENALPFRDSFDWANDGGIIRSVRLTVLPAAHLHELLVSAGPTGNKRAELHGSVRVSQPGGLTVRGKVYDPSNHLVAAFEKPAGERVDFSLSIDNPRLWHFDLPHLYTLKVELIERNRTVHSLETTFGIRRVEVRDGFYWLNGEPMRLMGVEWMPGSDPRYGMAESPDYICSVLEDMKRLNCIITRFHWQQDAAVFDFADRAGLLIQEEIPTWGWATRLETSAEVQEQQMREMILAHYNHPSIYAWGLCNEIWGPAEAGHTFVKNGIRIARELDPFRVLTYASNTVHYDPAKDASKLVDFVEWNDYYESWYGGGLEDVDRKLAQMKKELPNHSVVISEYGLCECSPSNPVGDPRRIEILRTHTDAYRRHANVAGAIFFDYNDYRTHVGDKGRGAYQQRVHGVVDVMNRRKPSWEALRDEMSPIKAITLSPPRRSEKLTHVEVSLITRDLKNDFPAYILRSYRLVWTALNAVGQPIEGGVVNLPEIKPGTTHKVALEWPTFELAKLVVEVYRPTGYLVTGAEASYE